VVSENSCRVREKSGKSQGILKSNVCGNPNYTTYNKDSYSNISIASMPGKTVIAADMDQRN